MYVPAMCGGCPTTTVDGGIDSVASGCEGDNGVCAHNVFAPEDRAARIPCSVSGKVQSEALAGNGSRTGVVRVMLGSCRERSVQAMSAAAERCEVGEACVGGWWCRSATVVVAGRQVWAAR